MAKKSLNEEFNPLGSLGTIADMAEDTADKVDAAVNERRAPEEPPKKAQSIGTLSAGISLVVFGILLVLSAVMPGLNGALIAALTPLTLLPVGAEILLAHFRNKNRHWYINWAAIFLCFMLLVGGAAVAAMPSLTTAANIDYHTSEERYEYQRELSDTLEEKMFTSLAAQEAVSDVSVSVSLYDYTDWSSVTLENLQSGDVSVHVQVQGTWTSAESFCETAAPIVQAVLDSGIPVGSLTIDTPYNVDGYNLYLNNRYKLKTTAAALVPFAEVKEAY